ncbi:hypothetical protein B296_00031763 [Ensete ventricosum]|uniref:Hydrophobic seed protein domain-containing protein n=1 Tax=Ensete ventricosum TaxID=4639 RepID=A0A426ZQI6_ENSVE|nr:hypothetical protein B296_00031763 [Ensete ventricosum]
MFWVFLVSRSERDFRVVVVYALRAKELLPPEVGSPIITSICFSMGPFGQGKESFEKSALKCRLLVLDIAPEVSLLNKVFNLVLEATISSFVSLLRAYFDRIGGLVGVELYRVRSDSGVLGLTPLCQFIFSNVKSNSSAPSGLPMWRFISNIKVHLLLLQILSADSIVNKEMQMSYDRGAVGVHYCSTMASFAELSPSITACNQLLIFFFPETMGKCAVATLLLLVDLATLVLPSLADGCSYCTTSPPPPPAYTTPTPSPPPPSRLKPSPPPPTYTTPNPPPPILPPLPKPSPPPPPTYTTPSPPPPILPPLPKPSPPPPPTYTTPSPPPPILPPLPMPSPPPSPTYTTPSPPPPILPPLPKPSPPPPPTYTTPSPPPPILPPLPKPSPPPPPTYTTPSPPPPILPPLPKPSPPPAPTYTTPSPPPPLPKPSPPPPPTYATPSPSPPPPPTYTTPSPPPPAYVTPSPPTYATPSPPPPAYVTPSPPTQTPYPPSPTAPTCPIDTGELDSCVDLLGGLVHIIIGQGVSYQCCPVLEGLSDLDAAVCLCATIKAQALNIQILLSPALDVLADCGKQVPSDFECPDA